jgi:hypothetical protein
MSIFRPATAFVLMATLSCGAGSAPADAQPQGLRPGQQISWQKPENYRSDYRGGAYTGTIERVDGSGQLYLLDSKGHSVKVRLEQLTAVDCSQSQSWKLDAGGGAYAYPVCVFQGAVNGPMAIYDWGGGLLVRLREPVTLRNGKTTDVFRAGLDEFGLLKVGSGSNQWAAKPGATVPSGGTPGTPQTGGGQSGGGQTGGGQTGGGQTGTGQAGGGQAGGEHAGGSSTGGSHGQVIAVPEVGQSYAQALLVGYPAMVEASMGDHDYDTYLFDFAGGAFHAHSSSNLDLVADLLDAQGKMIARARAVNGTFRFDQNLPKGRYGIIIRVMYYAGTGPYSLTLGSGAGPHYRERN